MKMKRVRQASKYLLKCLDPFCYDNKTFRDYSIYGGEYSRYGNLIRKQRLNKTPVFPYLIVLAIFARKIRFEQNDSIAPPYRFKREDMRLNLHCEFVD